MSLLRTFARAGAAIDAEGRHGARAATPITSAAGIAASRITIL